MARQRLAALVAGLTVAAFTGGATPAHALTLDARAGLGGIVRLGRWAPVRIAVQATGSEQFSGQLIAEWGDARLVRDVTLTAPARQDLELYIRSATAGHAITVQLVVEGHTLTRVEVPVRLASSDEAVTICIAGTGAALRDVQCSVSLEAADLPQTLRGYAAADAVVWNDTQPLPLLRLTDEQRLALTRWQALHRLDLDGRLSATPRLPSALPETSTRIDRARTAGFTAYLAVLASVALLAGRRSRRPLIVFPIVLLMAAAGSLAAASVGRVGSESAVVVRHTSVLQQLADASIVTTRAAAIFPAFDSYELRVESTDAAVERRIDRGDRAELLLDEGGYPVLRGTVGARWRQPFLLEAITDVRPLRVERRDRTLLLTNAVSVDITDCRLPFGSTPERIAVLRAGARAQVELPSTLTEAIVRCSLRAFPVALTERGRAVRIEGDTLVVAYLNSPGAGL